MIVYIWWMLLGINAVYTLFLVYTQSYDIYSRLFVTACAIRALCPRKYIERICLVSMWMSTPFVGRIAATVGEIAFAYQLSLVTQQPLVFYLGVIAQFFCWGGVITTQYQWHVYEEILWLMIGTICTVSSSKVVSCVAFLYCLYMYFVDIPMYQSRQIVDTVYNKPYFTWKEGVLDTMRCQLNHAYEIWQPEMVWMLGYFVVGTRISMYLSKKKYRL